VPRPEDLNSNWGRPRTIDRQKVAEAFAKYIQETPIPIAVEFAAQQGLTKQWLYEAEEMADLLKACMTKKESALERHALNNSCNVTMAIFSLKQQGWSDRQETTLKGPVQLTLSKSDQDL